MRVARRVIAEIMSAIIGIVLGLGLTALSIVVPIVAMSWCFVHAFGVFGSIFGWAVTLVTFTAGSFWLLSGMCVVVPFFCGMLIPVIIREYVVRVAREHGRVSRLSSE